MTMVIIDITQELFSCGVYPGDLGPSFTRVKRVPVDGWQMTNLSLGAHNGTHVDAPLHFIENGRAIDELPLDVFYGPCLVLDYPSEISDEERLLLKGPVEITPELARQLAYTKLRLLGVEPQSVSRPEITMEVHRILLGAGIVLLEGLDLANVTAGAYTLAAFPLKLAGCEGAPVRAVLIK